MSDGEWNSRDPNLGYSTGKTHTPARQLCLVTAPTYLKGVK
ncbi:hypothetical protein L915_01543 [Phytophthora nicotianae]|uniref:Uncharacterized protein n=1 Tax=Phytophthora nicotianae TaxID=4792 RepID=W2HK94_PHYNI|nr:hypothetical protein L915_01543 [Phytophthora nicotianae]ETM55231.1 hypothetical protein L914_01530 [Phytophthora nicotianae]